MVKLSLVLSDRKLPVLPQITMAEPISWKYSEEKAELKMLNTKQHVR
jgi:hypothetical protein